MRRNRVDPMGELHAVPQRGAWFGNRGCLHDAAGTIRRHHVGTRWITCVTAFKGRRRALMQPGRYTELFFLDEATAYAAGHRPCAECRREDFRAFSALWQAEFTETGVGAIDARLQAARWRNGRRLVEIATAEVPAGAMVLAGNAPLLRGARGWWRWSFDGYAAMPDPSGSLRLITPEPLTALLRRGLPVQVDASAE